VVTFNLCQVVIFGNSRGVLGEMDFWGGTFCLVLFATVEAILFAWVFGMDKAWDELHTGSDIHIPRIYRYIIKYITPAFLFFILGFWFVQEGLPTLLMKNVPAERMPFIIGTRVLLIDLFAALAFGVWFVWRRQRERRRSE